MEFLQIPSHMVRNNLQKGTILCSYLKKQDKITGIRFYGLSESVSNKCKGMSSFKNFDIFDYYFANPKTRLSENDKNLIRDIVHNFKKDNFSPTSRYSTESVDMDTLIKNTSFFQVSD